MHFPDDKADILAASLLISYCIFTSLIWSLIAIILLYVEKIFFKLKRLSDASVVSLTKKRTWLNSIFFSDLNEIYTANVWWMIYAICWSSLLSGLFGTLKHNWVIKTREMFNFLPLINNSVTVEFSFLLLIMSAIVSSKTINIFRSLSALYSSIFFKYTAYHLNTW